MSYDDLAYATAKVGVWSSGNENPIRPLHAALVEPRIECLLMIMVRGP